MSFEFREVGRPTEWTSGSSSRVPKFIGREDKRLAKEMALGDRSMMTSHMSSKVNIGREEWWTMLYTADGQWVEGLDLTVVFDLVKLLWIWEQFQWRSEDEAWLLW